MNIHSNFHCFLLQDELVNLPVPEPSALEPTVVVLPEEDAQEPGAPHSTDYVPHTRPDPAALPLNPPESLLQPTAYPDLHIFVSNPTPTPTYIYS